MGFKAHMLDQLPLFVELKAGADELTTAEQEPQMLYKFTLPVTQMMGRPEAVGP